MISPRAQLLSSGTKVSNDTFVQLSGSNASAVIALRRRSDARGA